MGAIRQFVACPGFALFSGANPRKSLTYIWWAAERDPHQMDDVCSIQACA